MCRSVPTRVKNEVPPNKALQRTRLRWVRLASRRLAASVVGSQEHLSGRAAELSDARRTLLAVAELYLRPTAEGWVNVRVEEEYADVLQNIQAAIIAVFDGTPSIPARRPPQLSLVVRTQGIGGRCL